MAKAFRRQKGNQIKAHIGGGGTVRDPLIGVNLHTRAQFAKNRRSAAQTLRIDEESNGKKIKVSSALTMEVNPGHEKSIKIDRVRLLERELAERPLHGWYRFAHRKRG